MMDVIDDFWAAADVAANRPGTAGPHLTGSRLSWAAARALGAQGAGITMTVDALMRLPWGASSHDAATTERLQFPTGEGPCITAHAHQDPVLAVQDVIERSWPAFAEQLLTRTPYRSVFAAPLKLVGAIDLYFTGPAGCVDVDTPAALADAEEILAAKIDDQFLNTLDDTLTWRMPLITRRTEISVTIGMPAATLGTDHPEALARLRAHAFAFAFANDQDLEDVAAAVITGTLTPHHLAS